ncbi:MAG: N-6 DNA methylase [Candidatus Limnocylindria bacterium]
MVARDPYPPRSGGFNVAELDQLWDAIREGELRAAGSGRPEAVLREHAQPAIARVLASRGLRSTARDEVRLTVPSGDMAQVLDAPLDSSGRADAIYNRFVIEFEPPGSLRPSVAHSATTHAVGQVQQYLRGVQAQSGLPLDRFAGCAFDGSWIVYVTSEDDSWHVARPRPVDRDALRGLLEILASLASGRALTAENLYEDFGPMSGIARSLVPALFEALWRSPTRSRGRAFFQQWRLDLGNASGLPSTADLPDWEQLCSAVGIPSTRDTSSEALFALQTYFGLVAKFVCLVVLEGATGHMLLPQLTNADDIWEAVTELEAGVLTAPTGAVNAIEPGLFSWYASTREPALAKALRTAAGVAAEYSAEVVEISPSRTRDIMKDLFQKRVPARLRHRLGEYYTPDWLAQHVLDEVGHDGNPDVRLLDPACGSGTFLVLAIGRIREWFDRNRGTCGFDESGLLKRILANVVGFDLSPLAVMAARTNYLVAVRDLLRHGENVELPVYLCDSILTPAEYGDLFVGHGRVIQLHTGAGTFQVPARVARDSDRLRRYTQILRASIESRLDGAGFIRSLDEADLGAADTELHLALYRQMLGLAAAEVDGIWANIIRNSFAPLFLEHVDLVVGNPPWVFWNTLPAPYRDQVRGVMQDAYGLMARGQSTMRRLGSAGKDISALFFYVACNRYLREGGRIGFVLTQTLFQSTASDEFRRWMLPKRVPVKVERVDDFVAVRPFRSAANKTATIVAVKGEQTEYPVPYYVWTAKTPFDRDRASLVQVKECTTIRAAWARPSSGLRLQSLWVIQSEPRDAERHLREPGPEGWGASRYRPRRGVETGLESVYRVRVLSSRLGGTLAVENVRERARVPVQAVQTEIEAGILFAYLTGATIGRWNAWSPGAYVVPHTKETGIRPIPETVLRADFPLAHAYLSLFRDQLQSRPIHARWGSANPFYALYGIGPYTFAPWKVVWKRTTRNFEAAVVSSMSVAPERSAVAIPNGKVMMLAFNDAGEAHFVCGVLNSALTRSRINSGISSEAHSELLGLITLPPYDSRDGLHTAIGGLSRACHEAATAGESTHLGRS